MDIPLNMSVTEQARLQTQVNSFNKTIGTGRVAQQELGRDEFLKILLTQLQNQDPTAPMEDTQFISQMAQFSTLEQMTNMTSQFSQLNALLAAGQASSMLGRTVEIADGVSTIQGVVNAVSSGDLPQVRIGDTFYDVSSIQTILE